MSSSSPETSQSLHSPCRLVVVQPDEYVYEERKAKNKLQTKDKSPQDAWEIASGIGEAFLNNFTIYPTIILLAKKTYQAIQDARESGLPIEIMTRAEANQLTFPPGHPRIGTLYIAHPVKPKLYYTAAMFHRMAFEHKFSEAVDLLMSLGATSLEVEHVEGWSREFSASMSTPLPKGPIDVEIKGSERSSKSKNILFKANLENNQTPELPDNMVWFNHEPTWESIAKGRLKYGMKEFSLVVAYQEDYGVNAGLKLTANKANLDLGGNFENHQSTTWKISGTFNK